MTLREKFLPKMYCFFGSGMLTNSYDEKVAESNAKECEKIADEFAIEFAEWAIAKNMGVSKFTLYEGEVEIFKQFKENMIGGAQPKILLTQSEDGTLNLDKAFEAIFGKELEPKYKLVRERDQLTKTSVGVKWLEFNEDGRYKADFKDIAVGRSLLMSPFGPSFTWQTTTVTEIVEQREDYIKFRTENSVYELFTL